ncbi:MAG: hypothetical protein ABH831_01325 [Candidatus Nealsonbacteria bacterium]
MKKRMPSSIKKYIRKQKSRIRREVLDIKKQKEQINSLYQKFSLENENLLAKTAKDKSEE